ncbi:MAG: threonine ammonia-lyase [Capsulimonadaceae bacterium]
MLTLRDIHDAAEVVSKVVRHTPLVESTGIRRRVDGCQRLLLKAENEQRTGSFKIRGAYYRLSRLTSEGRRRGVAAASAGNHAQGVALAAQLLEIPAVIFMPETGSIAKIKATESYGARVELRGRTFEEAVAACREYVAETGAVYISAYDDDDIIAGQGTLGLELAADAPEVDTVVIPIGGGGLFAGTAAALKETRPGIRIIGVQAEGADTAVRSYHAGKLVERTEPVVTICDGIAVKSPSQRTFEYILSYADDVVTISDVEVAGAMLLLLERTKMVVEPSGAAALAALLSGKAPGNGTVAAIVGGGNVDLLRLADIAQRELLRAGRYLHLFTACDDQPGSLVRLLSIVADQHGNIVSVHHNRLSRDVALGMTGVELLIEVRDPAHAASLLRAVEEAGYPMGRG